MPRQALLLHLNTSSFLPAPSWLQKIRSKQCAAPCCTRVLHYMPCTTLWPQTWTNVRCSAPVCERLSVICFFSRARWLLLRKCLRVQSPRKKHLLILLPTQTPGIPRPPACWSPAHSCPAVLWQSLRFCCLKQPHTNTTLQYLLHRCCPIRIFPWIKHFQNTYSLVDHLKTVI